MKTSETKTTSLLGRNIFPTPTPIDTTDAEMLQLLKHGDVNRPGIAGGSPS